MKKTAVLFPGQGSQYLGMGESFLGDADAAEVFRLAETISSIPVARLAKQGPMEELTRVLHLQPTLTAVNLICWQQLNKRLPGFIPAFAAGHSLGEYSALHAAGVITLEDTLRLVTRRGELMEREAEKRPGGMRAILGLDMEEIDDLVRDYRGDGCVVVANHNTAQQVVISGDAVGLEDLSRLCSEKGAKVIPLPVSLANHSPLVAGAVADFAEFIDSVEFQAPQVPVVFNVTAATEDDPAAIRSMMANQIASRVRWLDIVQRMADDGIEVFIELGPKNVLTGMMRKILPRKTGIVCLQADTPESMDKAAEAIAC